MRWRCRCNGNEKYFFSQNSGEVFAVTGENKRFGFLWYVSEQDIMSKSDIDFQRMFTAEEANATLPLVRAICRDLSSLSQEVADRKDRLSVLLAGRDENRDDPYRQELVQIEEELKRDTRRVEEYVQELRDLGLEPIDDLDGLVGFPSMMDDRVVFLSWRLDEPEVLHWHEIEEGFSRRQHLVVGSRSGVPLDDGNLESGS